METGMEARRDGVGRNGAGDDRADRDREGRSGIATLYGRWVGANALGELLGLGATFAAVGLLQPGLGDLGGAAGVLLGFLVMVAAGALEATVVAFAQHRAMGPWFPRVRATAWWRATLIGALLAYVLGYLPSTLMALGGEGAQDAAQEPPRAVVLLLAAALGAVAGAILSAFQAATLRRSARRAWRWIPANMLAWGVGMPVVFAGIDVAFAQASTAAMVVVMGCTLLATGAVVGAVHGLALVRLADGPYPRAAAGGSA